jgi:hypothetical protein
MGTLLSLKKILEGSRGTLPVYLSFAGHAGRVLLEQRYWVFEDSPLLAEIEKLFGCESVRFNKAG